MSQFQDLQYCKTDLIAAKGVVFCKFARASSALYALELVNETSIVRADGARCLTVLNTNLPQVAGYRVKCLLAEPKGKKPLPTMGMQGLDVSVRGDSRL